jgi:hypothetical protein
MNTKDPILESLRQLGKSTADVSVNVDVSARVLQRLRQRVPENQKAFPITLIVACLIALCSGVVAQQTWSSVNDPMSAVVSPIQLDLQW